jgi:predicted acetyltransferase
VTSDASGPQIVHPVPVADAEAWATSMRTTYLGDVWGAGMRRGIELVSASWDAERTWAARDHGRIVATLTTLPRTVTVPAGDGGTCELPMDALSGVTVAATHRRRGVLTAMLRDSLHAAKDRGDPLSGLIAAEWPIYGRFGYAPATRHADCVYRPRGPGARIVPSEDGEVRQVDPDELADLAPEIFARARQQRAGQIDRPGNWWRDAVGAGGQAPRGEPWHWFVHDGPDGPSGLLGWRPGRDWDIDNSFASIKVSPSFVAADDLAYRNLWAYLSGIDVVEEIELSVRPVDEPAYWLPADGRALRQTYTGDFLWLRMLDVPAALSARGYATSGRIVLQVVDDAADAYAAGRFLLDATADGAQCRPTSDTADLTLSARALASAYLGGHALRTLAVAGLVDEHRPGGIARLDAMLTTALAPWCQTAF